MKENIATIPLIKAFNTKDECPFCNLEREAEQHAVSFILGSAYMEDDIREKTDATGFCRHHFKMMYDYGNRLGNALILSTHLKKLNQELAKEFLRFLYSDESVSAFAEASGALYATKSAREVAKDKLSTAIYNMYGIYDEANASSLIMSFSAVPADCKINPKDEIFNPITSVMNDEMTVEEWAQNVEDAFAQVRADQEAAK